MKIMKVIDKKIGDTTYIKYRINLPKKVVEDSKLLDKEIVVKADKDRIVIEKNINKNIEPTLTAKEKTLQRDLLKLIGKKK